MSAADDRAFWATLQWGRAREGAESKAGLRMKEQTTMLQWGSAREGAESVSGNLAIDDAYIASMGPRP